MQAGRCKEMRKKGIEGRGLKANLALQTTGGGQGDRIKENEHSFKKD